jgi:membrane protein DedA with SNARE-associated domain
MHEQIERLIAWYRDALATGGYPLIALLMFVESTFVPLPSELVIPFAAHLAYTQGKLSLAGVVLAGAMGSWLGAMTMYGVARWAGRPLVLKYGRLCSIPPAKVEQAERWSAHYGSFGIFASRLLPVVRHLIGIPAGIVRLNPWKFSLYTLLGSALWCSVLAWVGVKAGQDEALMRGELSSIMVWVFGALAVLGAIYYAFVHRHMQAEKGAGAGQKTHGR